MSDSPTQECAREDPCRDAVVRDGYWAIFDTDGLKTQPGPRLVELIDHRLAEFIDRYRAT